MFIGNGAGLTNLSISVDAGLLTGATLSSNISFSSLRTVGSLDSLVVSNSLGGTGDITANNVTANATINATGNITGGNLNTGGLVSATGAITAGGDLTGANVSAGTNGNISGGNVNATTSITGSVLSVSGNITGGNISVTNITGSLVTSSQSNITSVGTLTSLNSGTISSSGNITGANINTGGLISASGNVVSSNVLTGIISASANITGGNLILSSGGQITTPSGSNGNVSINPDGTGSFIVDPASPTFIQNTYTSTSTTSGALVVSGGVGVTASTTAAPAVYGTTLFIT